MRALAPEGTLFPQRELRRRPVIATRTKFADLACARILTSADKEAAEKVGIRCPAPKGASDSEEVAVSLKRYPDTNPSFSAAGKAGTEKKPVVAALKCVGEKLCRPSGTRFDFPPYPGLTSWANIFRPSGAGTLQILFHPSPPQRSSHAHPEALHPITLKKPAWGPRRCATQNQSSSAAY
jgi:hypothetical protein